MTQGLRVRQRGGKRRADYAITRRPRMLLSSILRLDHSKDTPHKIRGHDGSFFDDRTRGQRIKRSLYDLPITKPRD